LSFVPLIWHYPDNKSPPKQINSASRFDLFWRAKKTPKPLPLDPKGSLGNIADPKFQTSTSYIHQNCDI